MKALFDPNDFLKEVKRQAEKLMPFAVQQNIDLLISIMPNKDGTDTFVNVVLGDKNIHKWETGLWYET